MLGYFFLLNSQFYSIFLHVSSCAGTKSNYCSFIESFEIRKYESSNIFLFQDYCGSSRSLPFPFEFQNQFAMSAKMTIDFVSDCTKYVNQLGEYSHLKNTVFQFINIGCFSNYFGFIKFLSLMLGNSPCTILTLLLLHLSVLVF